MPRLAPADAAIGARRSCSRAPTRPSTRESAWGGGSGEPPL